MDEREKIIEIIAPFISAYGEDEAIADALLAANIGDVTAWKERAEKVESQLEEQEAVNLYRMDMEAGKIDMTVGSEGFRDFFLALAQIFEQNNATKFLSTSFEITGRKYGVTIQKVGEKTVADELNMLKQLYEYEKHRAEVAERALFTACVNLIKDEADNVDMELLAHVVYTKFLRNAEEELAEEKGE